MIEPSVSSDVRFATELARRVADLLLGYFRREGLQGELKPDDSLVTEADIAADEMVARAIRAEYPQDALISEELSPHYEGPADTVWVIDPIDGTANFAAGLQHWGVCLARIVGGIPQTAVLLFPALDELYVAVRGEGATINGRRAQVRPQSSAKPQGILMCCSRTPRLYHLNLPYNIRMLGSSAYALVSVARGSAVVALEARPKIWDLAAASLVVSEAGGVFHSLHQQAGAGGAAPFPLRRGLEYAQKSFPVLAAASAELAEFALDHIAPR